MYALSRIHLFFSVTLLSSGLLDDPKEALTVKGLLQAHLPTLDKIYASRRQAAAECNDKIVRYKRIITAMTCFETRP